MKWAFLFLAVSGFAWAEPLHLAWPTPNRAWARGEAIAAFLQEAGSGDPLSGSYGSVRYSGRRFHEGIDLFPVRRDRHGEPLDPVFAAMAGVVRYINTEPERSSYGRYVVLEHTQYAPAVYTLYAHLASVDAAIRVETAVECGQVLGVMGRSAGGYVIPKQRAHLHFEIGLRLTDSFEQWYQAHGFADPNYHGAYNGMNLMGFDPLAFFEAYRVERLQAIGDWFAETQPAVRLHVATAATPDFICRYPSLVAAGAVAMGEQHGWKIDCDASGIPFRWQPLAVEELGGLREGAVQVVVVDEGRLAEQTAKRLVVQSEGQWQPDRDLRTVLELLFDGLF